MIKNLSFNEGPSSAGQSSGVGDFESFMDDDVNAKALEEKLLGKEGLEKRKNKRQNEEMTLEKRQDTTLIDQSAFGRQMQMNNVSENSKSQSVASAQSVGKKIGMDLVSKLNTTGVQKEAALSQKAASMSEFVKNMDGMQLKVSDNVKMNTDSMKAKAQGAESVAAKNSDQSDFKTQVANKSDSAANTATSDIKKATTEANVKTDSSRTQFDKVERTKEGANLQQSDRIDDTKTNKSNNMQMENKNRVDDNLSNLNNIREGMDLTLRNMTASREQALYEFKDGLTEEGALQGYEKLVNNSEYHAVNSVTQDHKIDYRNVDSADSAYHATTYGVIQGGDYMQFTLRGGEIEHFSDLAEQYNQQLAA